MADTCLAYAGYDLWQAARSSLQAAGEPTQVLPAHQARPAQHRPQWDPAPTWHSYGNQPFAMQSAMGHAAEHTGRGPLPAAVRTPTAQQRSPAQAVADSRATLDSVLSKLRRCATAARMEACSKQLHAQHASMTASCADATSIMPLDIAGAVIILKPDANMSCH